ncbi:MAG TPA: class I SAM-dependent methyltransferase [Phycisphaerae bacterium]|nr:class I SAM-dependent methyltransferase [Phycisphaerae bacterium]HRW52231.1 class I SAM-dependent methyltransferase [Phycisphaerae bacterium]
MEWNKDLPPEKAEAYKKSLQRGAVGHYTDESEQAPVCAMIEFKADNFLLDAGCANGRFLANAAEGQKFVGMDISAEMLKLARRDLGRGFFVVGELEHLPFKEGVFDTVISSRVLQHIHDQQLAINELARVAKPGGAVIVLTLNTWTLHCLYKNIRMSRFVHWIDRPLRKKLNKPNALGWSFAYDNYCSMPELTRLFRTAGMRVTGRKGGTIGAPWFFNIPLIMRPMQRFIQPPLRAFFAVCRWVEDRVGGCFPFTHKLDKIIVKGEKS